MVELQVISRILNSKDMSITRLNGITNDYFTQYREEFDYLEDHFKEYGNVPDKETFLSKFPDFDLIEVAESDKYLIDTFNEEHLYSLTVPVINKIAELIQTDSYEAVSYLQSKLPDLQKKISLTGVDIISQAKSRLEEWEKTKDNKDDYFIPSGFQELDEITGGFHCGEEFVVLFARTGQGKSWVLTKMLEHSWKMNKRVGLLEPEMSANKTGYRFDTIHKNFSNSSLVKGNDVDGYGEYIEQLTKKDVPFFVAHPKDFQRKVTISKLRAFVESNNLDILAIDGISYLVDERKDRSDNKTAQLTHISEDLMDLSIDLGIAVIAVCQSNREGTQKEDLELENIRDSDGIAYNASQVISVMQKENKLQLQIKKNRNGQNNTKLSYIWDIDIGKFNYVPDTDNNEEDEEKSRNLRKRYEDEDEVF